MQDGTHTHAGAELTARYEKVVNALNVQLEDLRAQPVSRQLHETRERPADEQSLMDTLYEEQGSVLGEAQQAQTQAETYVEELRARLEKLGARNTSSEVSFLDSKVEYPQLI